ncbi:MULTISPECIES: hypothetical protein [unclassified Sphingopyxis]|uniref:hypothetical protein n=1 Tax=unclassified Sphingopyxis TaxID=2614943 RepID=UPI000736F7F1|nr:MULTISPECIES: hypothetical protein [unclassified Sphingopyxis]KTE36570.1 hypothetical protein ATE62_14555 [Sphingopyxis sp. HIX]KTE84474.1 hypothetical protein ATE72_08415 [Sphingopyxis sp. HXXIV]
MLKRLLRGTATGAVGLCAAIWAGSLLSGPCPPEDFGCAPDSRLWVWLLFGAGSLLALSALLLWGAFLLQFRRYLREGDAQKRRDRQLRRDRLCAEARRVRPEIAVARELLARPLPDEPDAPTPAELQEAVGALMRRHSANYLDKAEEEPVRIVGWLLARLADQSATGLHWFGGSPVLGTVSINQDQYMQIVGVGAGSVALMTMDGNRATGEPVDVEDMLAALREANLPVWDELERAAAR